MTVALAVRRIAPSLLAEARAACSSLAVPTEDWAGGIPRHPPRVVITSIEIGDRRIPDDVVGLLEATPGVRALVCASEPLIKPRIELADGRVTLLSPPIDRGRLIAALRNALDAPSPQSSMGGNVRDQYEALRRNYWVAWGRGASGATAQLDESNGMTVVLGAGDIGQITRLITGEAPDPSLAAELAGLLGYDTACIHLSADTSEWRVYWPRRDAPLWMCSPYRLPPRWQIHSTLSSGQRFLRISGFPSDQLVAGWSTVGGSSDALTPIARVVGEGGPATLGVLSTISAQTPALTCAVVEIR